jgi:sialidase-1
VLLAFCEGRVGSREDYGNIDVVLKRSTDGGRTWDPLQVVAANGDDLAGNPAPVVLDTGRVLIVHVRNAAAATEAAIRRGEVEPEDGRRVWVQHSDDEGLTWSAPREITAQAKNRNWRWYATRSRHRADEWWYRPTTPSRPPEATPARRESTTEATAC